MLTPREILATYWQYAAFRPLQEEIIDAVLAGHDTLALLPTGGGKSVCFQVPALARDGICVVVSPLIALMRDQVAQLRRRNLPAVALYSGTGKREIDIELDNCVFGKYKFLYLSPERLQSELVMERVKRMNVCLLAVDEAHCISQWGEDFRPPYAQIADFRALLPANTPLIALTATATDLVKQDIQDKLQFRRGRVFQQSFARANLSYSAFCEEDKERRLLKMLANVPGTAIVYARSRKRTQLVAEWLQRCQVRAEYYHAGLTNDQRGQRQDDWLRGRTRVIVATNAFGMGIDKPDVRLVVHLDLPDTLEAYYQEAGRAGRDQRKAYAAVLYNRSDLENLERRVQQSHPPPATLRRVYQGLANYYQLAAGSSQLASYDFDLEAFKSFVQLPAGEVYAALQTLAAAGFVQLNESYYNPSKLMFTVSNQELYAFQVANAAYDPLIKLILRMYGGELFSQYGSISENALGKHLKLSVKDTVARLQHLRERGLVAYESQKDQPQLTFLTPRHQADKLPLDEAQLRARQQRDLAKARAVAHYAQHPLRCRTQLLLEYFGELTDHRCGVCDQCVAHRQRAQLPPANDEAHRTAVLAALGGGEASLRALLQHLPPAQETLRQRTLLALLDNGEIAYLPNGNLALRP